MRFVLMLALIEAVYAGLMAAGVYAFFVFGSFVSWPTPLMLLAIGVSAGFGHLAAREAMR